MCDGAHFRLGAICRGKNGVASDVRVKGDLIESGVVIVRPWEVRHLRIC